MKPNRRFFAALLLLCVLWLCSGCTQTSSPPAADTSVTEPYVNELFYTLARSEGTMDAVMFRVGKSDAMLFVTEHCAVLLDTGEKNDQDADKIIEYLKWRGEAYVTDSTNLTSDYTRNKIRLEIIPKMGEINPSILATLAATANRISEAEKVYNNAIEEAVRRVRKENVISIAALEKEIAPTAILHAILSPLGFNGTQIEDVAQSAASEGSRQFHAAGWSVIKDRERLIITPKTDFVIQETELPSEGCTETAQGTLSFATMAFDGKIPKQRNIACLDAAKLNLPLTLRNTRSGDRFAPFGMRGTKLVSDYLTDRKKNIIEKQQQLVVTDATGEIVWLVDERPSARCSISEKTKNVIRLEWKRQ